MDDDSVERAARDWYRSNWDPGLTVGEWFRRMFDGRWGYPTWPEEWGGRGLPTAVARIVRRERRAVGALGPPSGIGPTLLAPMLFAHGEPEQVDRLTRAIAYENAIFCQMLSEPDAGSDLAAIQTAAVRDGDEWRITGTKVWTSNVTGVTHGMLMARTDWEAAKHRGLTFFLCPAQQPGIEARPIRQMNGQAGFFMVRLDDAIVADRDRLGPEGQGWSVTRTFLAYEKNSYNPAAHEGGPFGSVDLEAPAGELAEALALRRKGARGGNRGVGRLLDGLVWEFGAVDDVVVRQELAALHTRRANLGYTNSRLRSAGLPGLEGPLSKVTVSDITRAQRDLGLRVQGPRGMLVGSDAGSEAFQAFALSSPATSIAGGTDEIQRNHLAEKVLGLPKERLDP